MYRAALRSASRPAVQSLRSTVARTAPRRFASTASPADKSRSWKSSLARWSLAVGLVYYYNVNSTLADEFTTSLTPTPHSDGELPTVKSIVEQRRKESSTRKQKEKQAEEPVEKVQEKKKQEEEPSKAETEIATETHKESETSEQQSAIAPAVSPVAVDGEASQDGAFNPETGEINWDCPCLGGMAHGPCGEQFKTAFSCFVYSTEEPKGMDCIEKFQFMQECFRQYPEIYGSELEDDTDADANADADTDAAPAPAPAPALAESNESNESAVAAKNAAEPVQSLQPVVEPATVTEPPVAEFQTLREDHSSEKSSKPESEKPVADQKVESATPWTDTTAANKVVKGEKK